MIRMKLVEPSENQANLGIILGANPGTTISDSQETLLP